MPVGMLPGDDPIHPARQILQHSWIGVFVDRETGAGVEAGEMQSTLADARAGQPPVDHRVQPREPFAARRNVQLVPDHCQLICHGSRPGSINLGSDLDAGIRA